MPKKNPQCLVFEKTRSDYGGDLMKKRAGRKGPRPLDTRNTMHLVLRSSQARGEQSFLRYQQPIKSIFKRFGDRHGVRILSLANVGNHLHLQINISNRYLYPSFIRATTAAIAMRVTGASKGKKIAPILRAKLHAAKPHAKLSASRPGTPRRANVRSFWDHRPWTRIVQGYRAILNLSDYIEINQWEGFGVPRTEARWIVTGRVPWASRSARAAP